MPAPLHKKLKYELVKYVRKDLGILLALSGGQDSLCLLQTLNDYYLDQQQPKVYSIYIDHQWKDDSLHHTHHILNLTKANNIPLAIYQIKILSLSENNARHIRYKTLIKHAKKKLQNYHYWS